MRLDSQEVARPFAFFQALLVAITACLLAACGGGKQDSPLSIPPTITSFAASQTTITSGASSTLSWSVSDATSISIQGLPTLAGNSVDVNPSVTTTYTLTASNAAGSRSAQVTVVVGGGGAANPNIWVMGYYVGYQSGQQPPTSVDYSAMTHIMVGTVVPQSGGTFDTNFYIDPVNGPLWAQDTVLRAHQAGIKAILMVGGAGTTTIAAFREVADATVRATFVQNLKTIVNTYGFDGVDIDWEPIEMTTPDDRPALLALSQDLRAAMPGKIMTIPVGWNSSNFNNMVDPYYGTLAQYYDRISMMSYGMVWTGAGYSSALYGETPNTPSSINNTTQALISSGVPKAKIGIGMGFYGVAYENAHWANNALVYATSGYVTAPGQNSDNTVVRFSDNDVSYANIMRYYYEPQALQWDDTAKASYLSFAAPKLVNVPSWTTIQTTYVPFEDERSIAAKGDYVKTQGLGGVII